MTEKKIIRTALDPTPRSVDMSPSTYDPTKDPYVMKKMAMATEVIEKSNLLEKLKDPDFWKRK